MALITGSTDKHDFADCDIVIEAVFEDMELKQSIFRELDEICKPGAIAGVEHLGARRRTRSPRSRLGPRA